MRCLAPQLPWLLLVLACGPGTDRQPAATTESAQAPGRKETQELLAKIDSAFNARELETLLDCFHPSHKTLHAQLKARMKAVLAYDARLQRESEIVKFDQRRGRAIALVRSCTRCQRRADLPPHVEHSYLVARTTSAGPKAELMVPVEDSELPYVSEGRFTCPACNYAFGGSCQWLAVPARPDQTGCMESLTFLALGHDLVVEISVHVLPEAPANKALRELLEDMRKLPWLDIPKRLQVRPWLPPAYAQGNAPCHLDGACHRVALRDGNGGDFADIHLATFGPIHYLMVVQGTEALLKDQAASIHDLLTGFRLLDTEKAPDDICRLALATHTGGGRITGSSYKNPAHNVQVNAPAGWQGAAYASRDLFRVRFQCGSGAGSLVLQGMAPPVGYTIWTQDKADELFQNACADRELPTPTDTAWTRGAHGFSWREARSTDPQTPCVLRTAMHGSLLVLMAGEARDAAGLEEIREAMTTLALLKQGR